MQITVNASLEIVSNPNIAPKANAGNDTTIIAPVDSVTLNGSGTDVDGSIVGYLWNQISGPSVSTISSGNTAIANISNLIEGTYAFELTVTDNSGAKGKDTVSVTVASGRLGRESEIIKVYPNPVSSSATIEYVLVDRSHVSIDIFDLSGKLIATVYQGMQNAGSYKAIFEPNGIPDGIYFCKVRVNEVAATRKLVIAHQ